MIAYFDPQYIDYILLQRTRLKTEYGLSKDSSVLDVLSALNQMTEKDFIMIQPYIMPPHGDDYFKERTILDIGCGLGTIDVFI